MSETSRIAVAEPPSVEERVELLHGPYETPAVQVGDWLMCLFRGEARVCGWSDGRIPWPYIRVGHGGKGAIAMTTELARAVRSESLVGIVYWFGVGSATVTHWRRALGVTVLNEGTLRLWSLWKEPKLPNTCVSYSRAALRAKRLAKGMTIREVAEAMGWTCANSYQQLETPRRKQTSQQILERLASVFGCSVHELMTDGQTTEFAQ